jgi:CDP-paratose 2-epimerase
MTKNNLKYIGYGGSGQQVRDVLHIEDLCFLILAQIKNIDKINNKLFNVGGSIQSFTTLRKLTKVCQMITKNKVKIFKKSKTSNYDIPFYISNISKVSNTYKWKPKKNIVNIVSDIYSWMNKDKNKIKRYFNCQ